VVRDIGGLVQQQGEVLNKVEEHVDTTKDNVVRANTDLIAAAKYQASYRKKCAFFILLLLIIVAIIVIPILIHVVPSSSDNSNSSGGGNGGGGSSPGPYSVGFERQR
jgi:t-SNARE complex subunit (syntaxin)